MLVVLEAVLVAVPAGLPFLPAELAANLPFRPHNHELFGVKKAKLGGLLLLLLLRCGIVAAAAAADAAALY